MADKKVSDLPSLNGADVDAADLLYIVDSSAGAYDGDLAKIKFIEQFASAKLNISYYY